MLRNVYTSDHSVQKDKQINVGHEKAEKHSRSGDNGARNGHKSWAMNIHQPGCKWAYWAKTHLMHLKVATSRILKVVGGSLISCHTALLLAYLY